MSFKLEQAYAVVRVENDWDAIGRSNGANVVGGSDGALNGCLLVLVVDALAGEIGGTTLGSSVLLQYDSKRRRNVGRTGE